VAACDDVVRAIQLAALVVGGKHAYRAVKFGANDATGRVFAGQHAAVPVIGIAVRHVARLAEGGDTTSGRPAPHVVARHVGEGQVLLPRMPDRPFGEFETGG